MKQFDSIPGTVHEDIDISVARITSKYIGHDAAEGVITLSHVGGLVVQHIPHVVVQTEHIQAPWMIELRKEASNSPWIRISAPLSVLSSMLII